jgi:hypothetical protein
MSFLLKIVGSIFGYSNSASEQETPAPTSSVAEFTEIIEEQPDKSNIEQQMTHPETTETVSEQPTQDIQPTEESTVITDNNEQINFYKENGVIVNADNNCLQVPYKFNDEIMTIVKLFELKNLISRHEFILSDEERDEYTKVKNDYRSQGVVSHTVGGKKCKRIRLIEVPKSLEEQAEKLKYFFCSSSCEIKK